MSIFDVTVDLSGLLNASPMIQAGVFRNLEAAVERVTIAGYERWKAAALRAPLWEGERQAYADAISWRMTGPLSGEIVCNYRYVEDIETGRPAYDLKRMLDTSHKVRVSKRGRRYLIIPFRHGTPRTNQNPMPAHVYAEARQLAPSRIVGQSLRQSGTGAYDIGTRKPMMVRQNNYKWGDALRAGMTRRLRPHHATDPHAGMVRFDTSSGRQKSSSYISFRTMTEGSPKWIIPPRAGLFIARAVAEGLRRDAESIFGVAIQTDLAANG
jgi:hypothetical protein